MESLNEGESDFPNDHIKRDFELLLAALNSTLSGIVITDYQQKDNPIIYINSVFEQITGFKRNEVIGRNCRFLQHDDRDQDARRIIDDALENDESCRVEIRNYKKDGTLFWNELYISPVKDKTGLVTNYIGVQNDITKRKKESLKLKLQQQQIEKQNLEYKEIERRKDDFLSIASHELKTPLTTVLGYLQMMNRLMPEDADLKFRAIVEKTGKYVNRLDKLLSELLEVSKIQSGNIELHKEAFDFDNAIKETILNILDTTNTHSIIIRGDSGVHFVGDESQIIQVIKNLLSNALKYSPHSSTILVSLSNADDHLKVSVLDQGIGINADDQKSIFDRFYRSGEIQQRYPGLGIGLYTCDQIIKNHGGTFSVESEIGKGSNFIFTLPVTKNELDGQ